MSFMQPEITFETFEIFETRQGTVCLPYATISMDEILKELNYETDPAHCLVDLAQAREAGIYDVKKGWFARLSAPGYMDATDWSGPFNSEKEAKQYLIDTYGEDDESDSD